MSIEIYDDKTFGHFLASAPDPLLLNIVRRLVERTRGQGLWESTCIVVGEPTAELLGFDPVADPPDWAWRTDHAVGWVELGLVLDDFGWILLVPAGSRLTKQA